MPIDVETPRSPGWWMQRLFNMLADRYRRNRLQLLHDYYTGHAPLPEGAENAREAFEAFQKKARSNFAELIVSAVSERMTPVGFRTALDDDATGDAEVGALWDRSALDVTSNDVHDLMLSMSEAFVIVGAMDPETGAPTVTAEDPRYMVADVDPANPRRLLAALKVLYDDVDKVQRAYLYLPGEVWVASRKSAAPDMSRVLMGTMTLANGRPIAAASPNLIGFSPRAWDWDTERSGKLSHGRIPVVRFLNKFGKGEFETHTDLLDRINHQILDRLVIASMQAFRQRAIKGLPSMYPDDYPDPQLAGTPIDYNKVFTAGPAALWQLPADADLWESAVGDLTSILSAVKDDLEHLAAVTRTPMHMLSPAGENQSAEGASLAREGLVFKTKDRIKRTSHPWAQVMSLVLIVAGQSERADLSKLQTIWAPPQQPSLIEIGQTVAQVKDVLPTRTLLIWVFGMSPADADRTMTEIEDERVLAAQLQATLVAQQQAAAAAGQATSTPTGPGPVSGQPVSSAGTQDQGGQQQ